MHIIENCIKLINKVAIESIYLLGSEGTIDSRIYQNTLFDKGIECIVPEQDEFYLLRECIEAVKQNKYTDDVKRIFWI